MKTLAALFLALLLAVMGYGIFWLVSLDYTTGQLQGAVDEALQADLTYGQPQWVPDPSSVTMDLPSAKLVLKGGPIREVRAGNLRLSSSFLMRDRWTMQLPSRVEVTLANGRKLMLETEEGEVSWIRDSNRLTLRAGSARVLDLGGNEVMQLGDLMLERRDSDTGVRLNLASRPRWQGGEAVLTGQVVMPPQSFANMVNLLAGDGLPRVRDVVRAVMAGMNRGAPLHLDNVSFKIIEGGAKPVSGAVFGDIRLAADGRVNGSLAVSSDASAQTLAWVTTAGVLKPRNSAEQAGVGRFARELAGHRATARLENMQSTLTINGHVVGPLPVAADVISRLWP